MAHLLRLKCGPCETWQLPRRPALTITNPPWGRRLMERGTQRGIRPADSQAAVWAGWRARRSW